MLFFCCITPNSNSAFSSTLPFSYIFTKSALAPLTTLHILVSAAALMLPPGHLESQYRFSPAFSTESPFGRPASEALSPCPRYLYQQIVFQQINENRVHDPINFNLLIVRTFAQFDLKRFFPLHQ